MRTSWRLDRPSHLRSLQRRLEAAQAEARQGFVRWLIILLALAAAAAYFVMQGK